jgi:DtxR family Mn-dependent transcriptional regulator
MVDPGTALLVFGVVVLAAALLLWPRWGGLAHVSRLRRLNERVRLEDALKHVYMCERRGVHCTLESLAGRLEVSTGRAAAILSHMAHLGVVQVGGEEPTLTDDGRRSALRIVRTHRLWERYLADRTGLPAGEWHDRAEQMEHALSAEETDALESRLGHPRWDPHGDPIPTAAGEMPPVRGMGLAAADAGDTVEVLHLEDEPREIFDALVARGLAPGDVLDVVARSERTVRVRAAGREWEVDTVAARNVTVRRLPTGRRASEASATLLDAEPWDAVRVLAIAPACQGAQRRRLLDLGVVRGTVIVPELVSMSGDPVAYRIRGALIALRREQASWISVEPAGDEEEVA